MIVVKQDQQPVIRTTSIENNKKLCTVCNKYTSKSNFARHNKLCHQQSPNIKKKKVKKSQWLRVY